MSADPGSLVPPGRDGPWTVRAPDGRTIAWQGFHTGPAILGPGELADLCRELLGQRLDEVDSAVAQELEPYPATDTAPCILLNSATTLKGCFEADLAALAAGRAGDDFTTYNETRAVYLARPGDLVVGRTGPWREAVEVAGRDFVQLPDVEYYYLSHALLKLAQAHVRQPVPALHRIVEQLRAQPQTVVRVFALEPELRVLLVWMKRAAELTRLRVEANGPQIADTWNHKSSLHPAVEDAEALGDHVRSADPWEVLEAESAINRFGAELGLIVPRLPGYTISREGLDRRGALELLRLAAHLLTARYGLGLGCFKPSTALTGARIRTAVPLDDDARLTELADLLLSGPEDFVLEAHVDYLRHRVEGHEFIVAPSAHVVGGALAEGATMQITRGSVWQGNVYVDRPVCHRLGLSEERYDFIRSAIEDLRVALNRPPDRALVKGGIDYAIGRLGGRFGDEVLIAMQDLNLSTNGAEFVRAFLREARQALTANGPEGAGVYAATKSVRPAAGVGIGRLQVAVDRDGPGSVSRAIASCPGRWGLIAVGSHDPVSSAEAVIRLERELSDAGLIEAVRLEAVAQGAA